MNTNNSLLFLNLSGGEIIVILLFVLIFFGAESIPKLARQFGKIMFQIKNATDDIKKDIKESTDNIKRDIMDQAEFSNPIKDIKKEILEEVESVNPVKELKSEVDNSIKDINI